MCYNFVNSNLFCTFEYTKTTQSLTKTKEKMTTKIEALKKMLEEAVKLAAEVKQEAKEIQAAKEQELQALKDRQGGRKLGELSEEEFKERYDIHEEKNFQVFVQDEAEALSKQLEYVLQDRKMFK
jgi:hypothetical protein